MNDIETRQRDQQRPPARNGDAVSALIIGGIVLASICGGVWLNLGSDRAACSSGLADLFAAQQCGQVQDWSTVLALGFFTGLAMLIWGMVKGSRS